ncbi:MAG: hypothetical protein ACSLFI_07785 [Solirubrobacterales bacterium]
MNFSRVHPFEWLTSICGLLVLFSLALPWYGSEAGFDSAGVLDVILVVVAIAALLLPFVVARSRKTVVPIAFETFLMDLSLLASIVLAIKLVWHLGGGLEGGFFVGLAGTFLLFWAVRRSTAREN